METDHLASRRVLPEFLGTVSGRFATPVAASLALMVTDQDMPPPAVAPAVARRSERATITTQLASLTAATSQDASPSYWTPSPSSATS